LPVTRIPAIILFRARLTGQSGTGADIGDGVTSEAVAIDGLVVRTETAGAGIDDGMATEVMPTDAILAETAVHDSISPTGGGAPMPLTTGSPVGLSMLDTTV